MILSHRSDKLVFHIPEFLRKIHIILMRVFETYDFSMLKATVERIQFHASAMEEALYRYEGIKYTLKNDVDSETVTDAEFREKAKRVLEQLKDNRR